MTKFWCMVLLAALVSALIVPSPAVGVRNADDGTRAICTLDVCHASDSATLMKSDGQPAADCAEAPDRSLVTEVLGSLDEPMRRFLIAFLDEHPPRVSSLLTVSE